ncbi:hypothetical protein AVEN_154793-1 [Araneus ventricosus]|uniref:Uncharacterized protein n=1 Tax=Araneus ventricosus TaxID=182803 RepID=A0A4Y2BUZ1_ARAVE|nr:hypothetical protein AVEN_154793-1 [Araneus ventricosus]
MANLNPLAFKKRPGHFRVSSLCFLTDFIKRVSRMGLFLREASFNCVFMNILTLLFGFRKRLGNGQGRLVSKRNSIRNEGCLNVNLDSFLLGSEFQFRCISLKCSLGICDVADF